MAMFRELLRSSDAPVHAPRRARAAAGHHLIDIFSGPRRDFSAQPWVRNADEYPALAA